VDQWNLHITCVKAPYLSFVVTFEVPCSASYLLIFLPAAETTIFSWPGLELLRENFRRGAVADSSHILQSRIAAWKGRLSMTSEECQHCESISAWQTSVSQAAEIQYAHNVVDEELSEAR
jgi:hypothetical protein